MNLLTLLILPKKTLVDKFKEQFHDRFFTKGIITVKN